MVITLVNINHLIITVKEAQETLGYSFGCYP